MSRCRLHLTKIDEFAKFCEGHGYRREPHLADQWEVLRLLKPGTPAIIAHARMRAKEHATLHGEGERMFSRFIRERNNKEVPRG